MYPVQSWVWGMAAKTIYNEQRQNVHSRNEYNEKPFANFPLERLTNRNSTHKYKHVVRNNVVIDCYESNQASAERNMETKVT